MKKINVTTKNEILTYPSLSILKAYADVELPKTGNGGWNNYFFNEPVKFNFDIPFEEYLNTEKFKYLRKEIEVFSPSGKSLILNVGRIINNLTGEVHRESVSIG